MRGGQYSSFDNYQHATTITKERVGYNHDPRLSSSLVVRVCSSWYVANTAFSNASLTACLQVDIRIYVVIITTPVSVTAVKPSAPFIVGLNYCLADYKDQEDSDTDIRTSSWMNNTLVEINGSGVGYGCYEKTS